MDAGSLKTMVLCHFRYNKRFPYVSTEAGEYNGDVVASDGDWLFEVETKVTRSDFKADFTKAKHTYYAEASMDEGRRRRRAWVPNYFFFAVPPDMEQWALQALSGHPRYGLLIISSLDSHSDFIRVSKAAKALHDKKVSEEIRTKMLLRMGSDLCNHYLQSRLPLGEMKKFMEFSKREVESEVAGE